MMLLAVTALTILTESPPTGASRAEFARAVSFVRVEYTESMVKQLLGPPHDVISRQDGDRLPFGVRTVWCYGTDGHLTFPSLGCIYFGSTGRVTKVFGGRGSALPPEIISERELQSLLRAVDRVGSLDGQAFNPAYMIEAVNRLAAIGKDGAIGVLGEYMRVASDMSHTDTLGVELILRVLFEVPEDRGYLPDFDVARTYPKLSASVEARREWPRFPMYIFNDIPILVVSDCILLGNVRGKSTSLNYYRENGRIRQGRLKPPDNPLTVLRELMNSQAWTHLVEVKETDKAMVSEQLLRMLRTVPQITALHQESAKLNQSQEMKWNYLLEHVSRLRVRWSARLDRYVVE